MSRYSIDTDQNSSLNTNKYQKCHLDTVQGQKSMNDGPVLKLKLRDVSNDPLTKERLSSVQKLDQEFVLLCFKSFLVEEAEKVSVCYFIKDKVLMRKWRPPDAAVEDEWKVVYQIVVPEVYQEEAMSLAHDSPMAGHLSKIYNRILTHFYWPNIRRDVAEYCRSCHTCHVVRKPNKKVL